MQISRHWRMNAQRYRLEGVQYNNGEVSLQVRPSAPRAEGEHHQQDTPQPMLAEPAAANGQ